MAKKFIGKVWLDPEPHIYIHRDTGVKYTSVTKILHRIVPEFNADEVALRISLQKDENKSKDEYIGMSKEQLLEYWQYLNDTANEYGTYVHETIEEYLFKNKYWFPDNELQQKVIQAYDNLGVDEGIEVWPERIMFAEEYELAGTADMIIDIDNVFFDVGDWKGLPIDTPIFTDSGWKIMETISEFDRVYDMNGELTKILHLSTIKNKPCYKITFDTNESIVSDFEHRWLISFLRDKKFKDIVMTTEELFNYINNMKKTNKRWSHKLPKIKMAKPLNNHNIELPIDPYVLGVWLGDGHSVDNKITNMNQAVWSEIERRGYTISQDISQGGAGKAQTKTIHGIRSKLQALNLLSNKHIPDVYLQSSYEQRLDMLRGFMDSDGYYNKSRKRFVMSTTRDWQVEAFVKLISSLGIKGTVIPYTKKLNGKIFDVHDICFTTNNINPFLCRNDIGVLFPKRNHHSFKNIISVEKVDSVPTRCIEVESDTHTFLYGHSFSVTHNTNKVFDFYNPYGNETLHPPFNHLQNCHYSIYTLQLSIYALMYEMETGRKCRQIWIGYWDKKTETMSRIPIMYLKHEAKKILDLHRYESQLVA